MCIIYAKLETLLGEIDRSRAVYIHGAQFADPRIDNSYWDTWSEFETEYGNEVTYKEMLRVKRSVETGKCSVVWCSVV